MYEMNKVAVVLATSPQDGGGHQYSKLVVECLKELSGLEFDLIAICINKYWIEWCNNNNIPHFESKWKCGSTKRNLWFPLYSRIRGMYLTDVGRLIKKERIDIIFLTPQLMSIPNWNVKIITPVHDLMHRYEPDYPEVHCEYQMRERVLKCQAKYADYILTDSQLGRKQFIESYLNGSEKVPSVVSVPFVVPDHIWQMKEEYLRVPDKYVFYPAQFWKHKNHINLIKAIQLLRGAIPDIHLVLVGSEKNNYEEIKKYIADNKLGSHITIMGFVSDENMTYLYRHAVGMIMPSYFGPTNIPPLEAMALGCPVAVSNKYAMPEQIGEAGLFFDPDSPEEIAECIRKLWTDDELRHRKIELGYKQIKSWTKNDFKKAIADIVHECLNKRSTSKKILGTKRVC